MQKNAWLGLQATQQMVYGGGLRHRSHCAFYLLDFVAFCLLVRCWILFFFKILRDSAFSFHWLSSSIFSYCSSWAFVPHGWHLLSSPLYDVSEHTNHIFSVRIWSWQHVSANISSVAELSPVYCCLVSMCATYFWGIVSTNNLVCRWMPPHAARYDKTDSNRQSGRWSKLKWSKTQNFLQNAETNLDALPAVVLKGVVVIMIYHQMVLVGNFD